MSANGGTQAPTGVGTRPVAPGRPIGKPKPQRNKQLPLPKHKGKGKPAPKGKGKGKGKGHKGGGAASPSADPYAAYMPQADAAARLQFGDADYTQRRSIQVAGGHRRSLDAALDKLLGDLSGSRQAQAMTQAANVQKLEQSNGQVAQQQTGMALAENAAREQGGANQYSSDLVGEAGRGIGAGLAAAGDQAALLKATGGIDDAAMARLQGVAQLQGQDWKGKANQHIIDERQGLANLQEKEDAFKVAKIGELQDADANRQIQVAAITQKDAAAQQELQARLAAVQGTVQATRIRTRGARDIAAGAQATSAGNANVSAGARVEAARIAARARRAAAQLAHDGAKGGGSSNVKIHDPVSGRDITFTPAQKQKWSQQRQNTIGAHRALRSLIQKGESDDKAAHKVARDYHLPLPVAQALLAAAKGHKTNRQQTAALGGYFQGGFVPPGYPQGKAN